jgi:hypothetical protein
VERRRDGEGSAVGREARWRVSSPRLRGGELSRHCGEVSFSSFFRTVG